jgi:hypothetical protein
MRAQHSTDFVGASPAQQTALLDALVEAGRNTGPEGPASDAAEDLAPGVSFFDWIRRMTVDAYYTSPIGIKDIGYQGNTALTEYKVPEEAITYAMRRRPA